MIVRYLHAEVLQESSGRTAIAALAETDFLGLGVWSKTTEVENLLL